MTIGLVKERGAVINESFSRRGALCMFRFNKANKYGLEVVEPKRKTGEVGKSTGERLEVAPVTGRFEALSTIPVTNRLATIPATIPDTSFGLRR